MSSRLFWGSLCLAAALITGACDAKDEPFVESSGPTAAERKAASEAEELARKEEVAAKKARATVLALDALKGAAQRFKGSGGASVARRRRLYSEFTATLEPAEALTDVGKYQSLRPAGAIKIISKLTALADAERAEKAQGPTLPDRPKYEREKYEGAFKLSGQVITQFSDGTVIKSGGKYYAVFGSECKYTRCWMYVEPAGRTIFLKDIGREGREAIETRQVDRETMVDDKRAYRDRIAAAKKEYATALKKYKQSVRANRGWAAKVKVSQRTRAKARTQLHAELDALLRPLAQGVTPAASKGDSKVPSAEVASSALASGAVARKPAKKARVKRKKPSRMACLRQCIGSCGSDENCERSCATTKCG